MEEQSTSSPTQNNPSDIKPDNREGKVRVGENSPSRFGVSDPSLASTTTDSLGASLLTGSPMIALKVQEKKEQKNRSSLTEPEPTQDVKDIKNRPLGTDGVKFPMLQVALKAHYGAQGTLQLPLSGERFPIKDVSLTISDKSEQDQREKARRLAEEKAREEKDKKNFSQETGDKKKVKESKKEKDKPDAFWSSRFRLEEEWHRIDKPIAIKDVFTLGNSTTPIRRVLVEGRAGVGKTTFSQYVAYQWVQQQLFSDWFDYLFWLPLRQCLSGDSSRHGSMEAHVAAFIYEQLPKSERISIRPDHIETVLSSGSGAYHRTLLVLDGFDEVAGQLSDSNQPFYVILDELLRFPNLIITTRDYQTPPTRYTFDRRLVNVGFTDAQISAYIQSYCAFSIVPMLTSDKEKDKDNKYETSISETDIKTSGTSSTEQAKRLEATLKQNPRFWGLAHIPLNLALICESWSLLQQPGATSKSTHSLPMLTKTDIPKSTSSSLTKNLSLTKAENSKTTPSAKLTMTVLYQNVLLCFLKRDIQKYSPPSTTLTWESLSESYVLELLSLGAIAWQGMQTQQQILGATPLAKALAGVISDYPEVDKETLEPAFTQALTLGLMRHESGEENTPLLERHYYFIHLTFQEYFAAYYVLQILQGRQSQRAWQSMQDWLAQHKYEPRYAVLLHFLAGLTTRPGNEQALQTFWHTLLSPPYDVVGAQHLQLMVRCLSEARFDSRILGRASLLAEIRHWVDARALMGLRQWGEGITTPWLDTLLHQEPKLLQLCGWTLPKTWIKAMSHQDIRGKAIMAFGQLGAQLIAHPDVLNALLKTVGDQSSYIRKAAIAPLGNLGEKLAEHPDALAAVLKATGDQDCHIRKEALAALGQLGEKLVAHSDALTAVLKATGDQDAFVRSAGRKALSNLGEKLAAYPDALAAVLKATGDQDCHIREEALAALGQLGEKLVAHSDALDAVLKAVGDKDERVRKAAIATLGKMSEKLAAHSDAVAAVLKATRDQNWEVQQAAIAALGKMGEKLTALPEALAVVLEAADDQGRNGCMHIRAAAIEALGNLGKKLAVYSDALAAVLKATNNQDAFVRSAVRAALRNLGEKLAAHPEALAAVLKATNDESSYVRQAMITALGKMGKQLIAHLDALAAVLKAAYDENEYVRQAAIEALGNLGEKLAMYPEALTAVLKATGDRNEYTRKWAIVALGNLGEKLAEHSDALAAVLKAAGDQGWYIIRKAAIVALGKMGEKLAALPDALTAVLKAVSDEGSFVPEAAIVALGNLGEKLAEHPEAWAAVLKAADDKNESVQQAAIESLGKLGEKLAAHPDALAVVLKAAYDREDVWKAAKKVSQTLDMILLVQGYLREAGQQQGFKHPPIYLPILAQRIEQSWPALAFDGQTLIVVSGVRSERFILSSPELAHSLIRAIQKTWEKYGLPSVPFKVCVDKKVRYANIQPPEFKTTSKLSLSTGLQRRSTRITPEESKKNEVGRLNSVGHMLLDFTIPYLDLTFTEPPLGQGAFGAVYRGIHQREEVAIKRFLLNDFSSQRQEEIRNEASVMAGIQSDYLVRLRGICLEAPNYCLVMEYLPKGDLYGVLHPKPSPSSGGSISKPLTLSQWYRLATDMAIGLYRLHLNGILHRDLKSLNVLLHERNGELRAKLSDFGLATLKRSLLQGEEMVGSLPWLAPEIVTGRGEYSKASDIYSLGLVLYELATSKLPYFHLPNKPAKPSGQQIKEWIAAGERPWSYLPEECPAELAQLIRDCCAEDPKDRPAANILVDRLDKLYVTAKEKETLKRMGNLPLEAKVARPASSSPKENKQKSGNQRLLDLPSKSTDNKDKKNRPFSFGTTHSPGLFPPQPVSSQQIKASQNLQTLKQTLQKLNEEQGYTFTYTRLKDSQLQLAFTGFETVSVFMKPMDIQKQLAHLTRLLQQGMSDYGIPLEHIAFNPNFKTWTLMIEGEPTLLDKLNQLLQTAGLVSADDAETEICRMQ